MYVRDIDGLTLYFDFQCSTSHHLRHFHCLYQSCMIAPSPGADDSELKYCFGPIRNLCMWLGVVELVKLTLLSQEMFVCLVFLSGETAPVKSNST